MPQHTGSINDEDDIIIYDRLDDDKSVPLVEYKITSYGADFDVHGLVRRLKKKSVIVPEFQRNYVWKKPEASRFIESLLLGLPVPGIFLAKEQEGENLLVIDGQQRLKTLMYFYDGFFHPKKSDKAKKIFSLDNVQREFEGKTYETLTDGQRTKLDDSIIHATIVKQTAPEEDKQSTSIYHIFERLNSEGRKLTEQEIRCAVYYGDLIEEIDRMNQIPEWRYVFSKESNRQKDKELILRFLALYHHRNEYQRPMAEFLNKFAIKYRKANRSTLNEFSRVFTDSIKFIISSCGESAFKPERQFNAAVFDSVMVAVADAQNGDGKNLVPASFKVAYEKLIKDEAYLATTSKATADERQVSERIKIAKKKLG